MRGVLLALLVGLLAFAWGAVAVQHQVFPHGLIAPLLGGAGSEMAGAETAGAARAGGIPQAELDGDQLPPAADAVQPVRRGSGKWYRVSDWVARRSAPPPAAERAELQDVPYLRGVQGAPAVADVTLFDAAATQDGVNLVLSGSGPAATLCDLKGNVLHRWSYPYEKVWPGALPFAEFPVHKTFWRRVHLYPDGSLLAIFEGIGMIKVDVDSKLLWQTQARCHHDIDLDPEGNIYTLSHHPRRLSNGVELLDDFVLVLSPQGETLAQVSVLESFQASDYAGYIRNAPPGVRDVFHTNTVVWLDGRVAPRLPSWAAGNVLISIRNLDLLAVVDLRQKKVVWAMTGMWGRQHQPSVLANGHVLLFDNVGTDRGSRVLEFDPVTQQITWSYAGTPREPFVSAHAGSCQRLRNGNTLIVESVSGRAFEVTSAGKIVWEFINPDREGEAGDLIAVLYDVVRFGWDELEVPAVVAAREALRVTGK